MNIARHGRTTALCIGLMSTGAGCAPATEQELVAQLHDEPSYQRDWETFRDAATRHVDGRTLYNVEWDMFFADEVRLQRYYDELTLGSEEKSAVFRQISTGFEPVYGLAAAQRIRYCVSDHFLDRSNTFRNKTQVVSEMAAATRAWSDLANLRFVYVPAEDDDCDQDNPNVEFAVLPYEGVGFACASNKLQWQAADGCPTPDTTGAVKGVLVTDYVTFPSPGLPAVTTTGVLRHELGHMLGLRHEHPWAPGQGGCGEAPDDTSSDTTGRRLTAYDQRSVMHYPQCSGITTRDLTLSELDGDGLRKLYGMPVPWYVAVL